MEATMSDDGSKSDDSLFHTDISPIKDISDNVNGGSSIRNDERIGSSFYAFYENDEEKACEDVQRMAATFAPQVSELEDVLKDMIPVGQNGDASGVVGDPSFLSGNGVVSDDDEWDDDMHDELRQLATSEQLLREELEFASNFSSLMATPATPPSVHMNSTLDPPTVRPDAPEMTPRRLLSPHDPKEDPPERVPTDTPDTAVTATPSRYLWSAGTTKTPNHNGSPPRTPGGSLYTLDDHAEYLKLRKERSGGWFYCDMTSHLAGPDYNAVDYSLGGGSDAFNDPSTSFQSPQQLSNGQQNGNAPNYRHDLVKDYCTPLPIRKLKRLYCGLVSCNATPIGNTTSSTRQLATPQVPATPQTPAGEPSSSESNSPLSTAASSLQTPQTPMTAATPRATPRQPLHVEEPLPVRTIAIRIRPDVLCGAVMDAINHALEGLTSSSSGSTFGLTSPNPHQTPSLSTHIVMKRQGGHFRGAVAVELPYFPDNMTASTRRSKNNTGNGKATLGYVVDAQMCTLKNDSLERTLLVRFYHIQDDLEAQAELSAQWHGIQERFKEQGHQQEVGKSETETQPTSGLSAMMSPSAVIPGSSSHGVENDEARDANRHLKQSCSLIFRIMAAQAQGAANSNTNWVGFKDKAFASREALQDAIGKHLETKYTACPSVREGNKKLSSRNNRAVQRLTMPSLSIGDWPLLKESWALCSSIFEELDNRDCTYNTLSTLRFGQFPSLTTLDVQYCSQLRRLSREAMISQLLSSARELENYAKSAEYNCANVLTLLEPRVKYYGIPLIDLPLPKPLEDYPLDFTPPQVVCPPWGVKVMEALNRVAESTTMRNEAMADASPINAVGGSDIPSSNTESGIAAAPTTSKPESLPPPMEATEAVKMVYAAFTRHDDEEYGARLGRKNTQVMERLASMQSHQRAVLHSIRDAHSTNRQAAKAAESFLAKAQLANNAGQPGHPSMIQQFVPVLSVRISIGASTSGDCTVTTSHIMFQTSYLPLVGRTTTTLLDLSEVEFQPDENAASTVLNPFPNTVNVLVGGQVVYGFRPKTLGATRLCNFLNVLKGYQSESTTGTGTHNEFHQPDELLSNDGDGDNNANGPDGTAVQDIDIAEAVSDDGELPI